MPEPGEKYTYFPKGETVLVEPWCWEAHYADGGVLKQFDQSDKSFHRFDEIEQYKVKVFKMVHHSGRELLVHKPDGGEVIHFYRNLAQVVSSIATGKVIKETRMRVYGFGFRVGKTKVINLIMPDDNVITTLDPDYVRLVT